MNPLTNESSTIKMSTKLTIGISDDSIQSIVIENKCVQMLMANEHGERIVGYPNQINAFQLRGFFWINYAHLSGYDLPPESEADNKKNSILEGLQVEIFHNKNEEDVNIKIFSVNQENLVPSLRRSSELDLIFKDVKWDDFKNIDLKVSLLKIPETNNQLVEPELCYLNRIIGTIPISNRHSRLCSFERLQDFLQKRKQDEREFWYVLGELSITLSTDAIDKEKEKTYYSKLQRFCQFKLGNELYAKREFGDFNIKIKSNGKYFPCHKCILDVNSKVFGAMFSTNMIEAQSSELIVEDMTEECIEALLKFLYMGDLEDTISNHLLTFDLLKVSHKYEIDSLESACREILLFQLNENVDLAFLLRVFHFCILLEGCSFLLNKIARIIGIPSSRNFDKVVDSKEFVSLLEENQLVALKLLKMAFASSH